MQSNIKLTEEQLEILHKFYDNLQPMVETIVKVWNAVKELFIRTYENLKEFLSRKVSIKTKSYKKGKKYVHKYKHIELWKMIGGSIDE